MPQQEVYRDGPTKGSKKWVLPPKAASDSHGGSQKLCLYVAEALRRGETVGLTGLRRKVLTWPKEFMGKSD
jgi:hypothetical protein